MLNELLLTSRNYNFVFIMLHSRFFSSVSFAESINFTYWLSSEFKVKIHEVYRTKEYIYIKLQKENKRRNYKKARDKKLLKQEGILLKKVEKVMIYFRIHSIVFIQSNRNLENLLP